MSFYTLSFPRYVDPHEGNDGNSGSSEASPFATVHRGITAARAARSANPTESQAVLLRGGATHYLGGQTVSLTSADSGLTIGTQLDVRGAYVFLACVHSRVTI